EAGWEQSFGEHRKQTYFLHLQPISYSNDGGNGPNMPRHGCSAVMERVNVLCPMPANKSPIMTGELVSLYIGLLSFCCRCLSELIKLNTLMTLGQCVSEPVCSVPLLSLLITLSFAACAVAFH